MTDDNKQEQTSSFKKECTIATTAAAAAITSRKRKFLTPKEFFNLGGDEIKRKIKPIQKWTTLIEGAPYLMKRVIELGGGGSQVRHYAEVENEKGETNNVWISDIILDESKKYKLIDNDVYIMPLGKTVSKESGFEYHDFVIMKDSDVKEQ